MTLLSVKGLTITQPSKTLFKEAAFGISAHDKVAVIGPNGCGKSTLLNIISQIDSQPNDAIVCQRGLRLTYLSQNTSFNETDTIKNHIYNANTDVARTIKAYQDCLEGLNNNPSDELNDRFEKVTEQMEHVGAWAYEDRVNSILRELHITDLSQKMGELSGGMLKKIAFAKLFLKKQIC